MEQALDYRKERDLSFLQGKHVRMWPYSRGEFPRDVLYRLWRATEGLEDLIFFGSDDDNMSSYKRRGDLTEFMIYMAEPTRFVLIAEVKDEIAGAFWIDQVKPRFSGAASYFYRRKFWGHAAREASSIGCRYGFEILELEQLWGMTPWMTSIKHARVQGAKLIATLPGFYLIDGLPHDCYVSRLTKEDYYGRRR